MVSRKNVRRVFVAACLFLTLAAATTTRAQDVNTKKPLAEWSRSDVEKVLNDSPWVVKQTVKIRHRGRARAVAGSPVEILGTTRGSVNTSGAEAPIDFTFTLRLRSALPIRKALARRLQLEAKSGDLLSPDFDRRVRGLVECPACADNYVLTLSAASKESPGADPVFTTFQGVRFEDVRRYVYLANERGERRELVHVVGPKVAGDEAVFYFPRFDDEGRPLLTTDSRELIFNLTNNQVSTIANFRIDVSKILLGGSVEF